MFYFRWALKNLLRNKKQTLILLLLIVLISVILFLNLAFLAGTQQQMKDTLRKFVGDIAMDSRGQQYNLAEVTTFLENYPAKNEIDMVFEEFSFTNVRIISNRGYLDNAYIRGYSDLFYNWMAKSVDWVQGGILDNAHGKAVIEKSVAQDLGVSLGDNVTVEYKTDEGAINTAIYNICGVFIGNKYIHYNAIYISLEDAQNLAMVEGNTLNHLKIYLKNHENDNILKQIVDHLKTFSNLAYISVWKWEQSKNIFFSVFNYGQIFMKIIVTLVTFVLIIVLFFAIQNTLYLIFNKRSNEISILTTYGMPFREIYQMVFWETIFLFGMGLIIAFLCSLLLGHILSGVSMAHLSNEMVVILGGPRLQFYFSAPDFLKVMLLMFLVGLYAGLHSLKKYFKLEVREMSGGILG